jgi:hypothetical protein
MKSQLFRLLQEWTRLESMHFEATHRGRDVCDYAPELSAKEAEILAIQPRTKEEAFAQLRFCAVFLERNCNSGNLAAGVIRNAANVLLGWREANYEPPSA